MDYWKEIIMDLWDFWFVWKNIILYVDFLYVM